MNAAPVIVGYFIPIALAIVMFVVFKLQRPPLPSFEKPQTEVRTALYIFVFFAVIVTAASLIFKPAHDLNNLPIKAHIYTLLLWIVLLLPLIAVLIKRKQGLDTCLIPKKGFFFHLAISAAMGFLSILVYLLTIGKVNILPNALANLFTLSSIFFLIPIFFEEFVFRGFLLARLTAGLGRRKGILLSALMFGLIHYPRYLASSQTSFIQVTGTVVLVVAVSIGGGYGIYSVRCMLYGVFIHWCMNSVQAFIPAG